MNRTKIEFCDFTWNPIVGCQIGCPYCWARRFHNRFNKLHYFEDPKLYPERLREPKDRKKPASIFVCSMGDIFSPGVKDDWIQAVLEVVEFNPLHTFKFLTKRPERYKEFDFPMNVWLGTSIDYAHNRQRVIDLTACGCKYTTFVLVEPILSYMSAVDFSEVDFLYVGAMTGPGAKPPDKNWIRSIKHHNIIYKENIKKVLMKIQMKVFCDSLEELQKLFRVEFFSQDIEMERVSPPPTEPMITIVQSKIEPIKKADLKVLTCKAPKCRKKFRQKHKAQLYCSKLCRSRGSVMLNYLKKKKEMNLKPKDNKALLEKIKKDIPIKEAKRPVTYHE